MARLLTGTGSTIGVDMVNLDLSAIFAARTAMIVSPNDPVTVRSIVYTSTIRIDFPGTGGPLWLYGDGISQDIAGNITGGTISGLALGADQFNPDGILQQFTLNAVDVYTALQTASTADDITLFALALAGDDTFNLNNNNHSIYAYSGNDTVSGARGNDLIFGGDGNDSLDGFFGLDTIYG